MDKKTVVLDKIQQILGNAGEVIVTKKQIERVIVDTTNQLLTVTENKVNILMTEPSEYWSNQGFALSETLIFVDGNIGGNLFYSGDSILLFGYAIDHNQGYPITIQTREEDFTIFDEESLVDLIIERIEKYAVRIMEIVEKNKSTQ